MARGPRIFISYRRDDSAFETSAIRERMAEAFGAGNVFMDVDNIPAGRDFRVHLQMAIQGCDACVAVIGDGWLGASASPGTRRLDDERDFVRIEIEAALQRGIPVIPLLVGKAPMPAATDVPPSLQELCYRQALTLRAGRDFRGDMQTLIDQLKATPAKPKPTDEAAAARRAAAVQSTRSALAAMVARARSTMARLRDASIAQSAAVLLSVFLAIVGIELITRDAKAADGESWWVTSVWPLRMLVKTFAAAWLFRRLVVRPHAQPAPAPKEGRALLQSVLAIDLIWMAIYVDPYAGGILGTAWRWTGHALVALFAYAVGRRLARAGGKRRLLAWIVTPLIWCVGARVVAPGTDFGFALTAVLGDVAMIHGLLWLARKLPAPREGDDSNVGFGAQFRWSVGRCLLMLVLWAMALATMEAEAGRRSTEAFWYLARATGTNALIVVGWLIALGLGAKALAAVLQHGRRRGAAAALIAGYAVAATIAGLVEPRPGSEVVSMLVATCSWFATACVSAWLGVVWLELASERGAADRRRALFGALAAAAATIVLRTRSYPVGHAHPLALEIVGMAWSTIVFWSFAMIPGTGTLLRIADSAPEPRAPMQRIRVICPSCGASLLAGAGSLGKTLACPKCSAPIQVPAQS